MIRAFQVERRHRDRSLGAELNYWLCSFQAEGYKIVQVVETKTEQGSPAFVIIYDTKEEMG